MAMRIIVAVATLLGLGFPAVAFGQSCITRCHSCALTNSCSYAECARQCGTSSPSTSPPPPSSAPAPARERPAAPRPEPTEEDKRWAKYKADQVWEACRDIFDRNTRERDPARQQVLAEELSQCMKRNEGAIDRQRASNPCSYPPCGRAAAGGASPGAQGSGGPQPRPPAQAQPQAQAPSRVQAIKPDSDSQPPCRDASGTHCLSFTTTQETNTAGTIYRALVKNVCPWKVDAAIERIRPGGLSLSSFQAVPSGRITTFTCSSANPENCGGLGNLQARCDL